MYKRWEPASSRRRIRHILTAIAKAKTWQLVVVFILLAFVSATLLRLNNLGMVERRQAVFMADKTGDKEYIRQKLADLQHYASAHMNADPGTVALQGSFNRDYEAAIAAASKDDNTNSSVYQKASVKCRERFQGGVASFRNDYVKCVAAAVSTLPANQQTKANLPHPQTYSYSFSSASFSFDLAGMSVMITSLLLGFIVIRITEVITLRLVIKRRSRSF